MKICCYISAFFLSLLAVAAAAQPENLKPGSSTPAPRRVLSEYDASITFLKLSLQRNWSEEQFFEERALWDRNRFNWTHTCMGPLDMARQNDGPWNEQLPFGLQLRQALETCMHQRALIAQSGPRTAQ